MKKKILALITFIVVAVLCFTVAACGGGNDDGDYGKTFAGKLSEQTYTTAEEAAAAFIENEISGNTTHAVFVSYEKVADVAEEDIAELLGITEDEVADIESVEEGVISYTETIAAAYSAESSDVTEQKVYIVHYVSGEFRYFVPVVSVGEVLTKSYYEWVMDPDNYKNCTMTMSMQQETSVSITGFGTETILTTTEYTYRITESAVYLSMQVTSTITSNGATETETEALEAYIVEKSGTLLVVAREEGGPWQVASAAEIGLEFESIEDIVTSSQVDGEDWTLFVKTQNGFVLRSDRINEYLDMYLSEDEEFQSIMEQFGGDLDISLDAEYFLTEDRISKSDVNISMGLSMSQMGMSVSVSAAANATANYSSFGSTVVDIPAEVQALIA